MTAHAIQHAMQEAPEVTGLPTMPDGFSIDEDGWLVHESRADGDGEPRTTRICSQLEVVARTAAVHSGGHGYLLRFPTDTGFTQEWAMPASMLKGSAEELRGILLDMGLMIDANQRAHRLLTTYINLAAQRCAREGRLMTSTQRTGWHGDAYVLPDRVLGNPSQQRIVYQRADLTADGYRLAGTLEAWQRKVAALCQGNSRLVFGVAAALAPTLLAPCHVKESFGFHLYGESSSGKTTILTVANSVWGDPDALLESWNNTANGLEGIATTRSDGLLTLDELHQCDPRSAGKVVYMLAEGRGKGRAKETGVARERARWRLIFLSTGELTTADHIASEGGRSYAGQAVRAIVLPSDAGAGLGAFNQTHDHSGEAFANRIDRAAREHYGHAAAHFIEHLASKQQLAQEVFTRTRDHFRHRALPPGASGQVYRVGDKFALVVTAGLLASQWGIVDWDPEEITTACTVMFREWLSERGTSGDDEPRRALEQVRAFLERHGESRFTPLDGAARTVPTRDRAGYVGDHRGYRCYLFTADGWKEACQGFGPVRVARWLAEGGFLLTEGKGGRFTCQVRGIPGHSGPRKLYAVPAAILEGGEEA
ncbi:DUF927 domain-containing protein [Halomonas ramblicola]|uniref:DUF927 domain-containing protein n=1 Tax=Halomonas ramblicola TaxID=747349 RepID=UPI0025B5AC46|nr:DUF927 domain-containing protein [Halomonas ramblicola]MDN3521518.1 DUF927 domain-containing protein [Halomonas ramblicola]